MENKNLKKPRKTYSLIDFVVIKKRNDKTKKTVFKKIHKKLQKRGKVKNKKHTTLKKKIIKDRDLKKKLTEEIKELKLNEEENDEKQEAVQKLHSRSFREFCTHLITPEIKNLSEVVLKDLFRFQENKFQQNPVKARAKRRYVVGFKEVKKFLMVERLKLIFIASDLEKSSEIDTLVNEIKAHADKQKIPYVFSLKRRKIGFMLLKKVPISIVGIFDVQGTDEYVKTLLNHVESEKINYRNKIQSV